MLSNITRCDRDTVEFMQCGKVRLIDHRGVEKKQNDQRRSMEVVDMM